jgi:Rrf2 family transcriptional regulator, cysteine metabolism repressor
VKISTKGEYGIRAMLYLASKQDEGPVTSHEIAVHQGIPEPYLRQILAVLSRDGLVRSNRGPQGGHLLGRNAAEISLQQVLVSLEGQTTSIDQVLALPCSIGLGPERCAIREVFLQVKEAVNGILGGTSLAELAERQSEILRRNLSVPLDVPPSRLPVIRD